ncbi:hypothetical protein LTR37_000784 [Vermiconidia calcicola]|uniref:Uncharacterized protein n=1 Tax=Vermiconidia calcicola TaxID=1690605 RepID=A0ACC3NXC4_9PEZI|nr:hypothetical protein LTR37_000784 [Vermiconidia calcicola]
MDWPSSPVASYGRGNAPNNDGVEAEEDEDFYGYGSNAPNALNGENATTSGAPNTNGSRVTNNTAIPPKKQPLNNSIKASMPENASTPTAEQKKAENQRKAERLRAKLMAQRQNTPSKTQSPRANTPVTTMSSAPAPEVKEPAKNEENEQQEQKQQDEPSSDFLGLESLLAEGMAAAAAEAQIKEQQNAAAAAAAAGFEQKAPTPPTTEQLPQQQQEQDAEVPTQPQQQAQEPVQQTDQSSQRTNGPAMLTDAYYADLSIWLEITGYHDVEYRNSKLHTFKERKALEAEAARIQEQLEKLRQNEQATIESLRTAGAYQRTPARDMPPALPAVMPAANGSIQPTANNAPPTPATNGVKRAHSPEPVHMSSKVRRPENTDTGFRIRGANDSPDTQTFPAGVRGRVRSRSPAAGVERRRISYPEARRGSLNGYSAVRGATRGDESRDPSLERRQAYYRPNEREAAAEGYRERYEQPQHHPGGRETPRARYSTVNVKHERSGPRGVYGYGDRRGSAGLDLRNGGVRYFMIKSWNHENVLTAMRDGLWATQQKNEQLLTEAFNTSRHVLLLFSVNKSTQFQGYAQMITRPDPFLQKPSFCQKLNWATSPSFKLRWLATTPVYFKHVGHLKNTMNLDEKTGEPMAVLVGKDGQEISADAGQGVVRILDEVEESEGGRLGGEGRYG